MQRGPVDLRTVARALQIAVKDNVDTRGIASTNGSPLFAERVPETESTVIVPAAPRGRHRPGKGRICTSGPTAPPRPPSATWPTRGIWRPRRVRRPTREPLRSPAGLATAAIGTDLGGSIRIPAAMCGIYGLKPTYSMVRRAGVGSEYGQTLDHVGPMTGTAADAQLILQRSSAGRDNSDPGGHF